MRKITAGNWKMNLSLNEAKELVTVLSYELHNQGQKYDPASEMIISPSYPWLESISNLLQSDERSGGSKIKLAAQDVDANDNGAYTGKVSIAMLKELKVDYCIIGHSELRSIYHESDELINAKVLKLLENDISPILCIGETLEERQKGQLKVVLKTQLVKGLNAVSNQQIKKLIIAYEPVWAIGTGVSASEHEAEDAHQFVCETLVGIFGESGKNIPILYGGSVKPGNAEVLFTCEHIAGGLIGGASLKSDDFLAIHRAWKK